MVSWELLAAAYNDVWSRVSFAGYVPDPPYTRLRQVTAWDVGASEPHL